MIRSFRDRKTFWLGEAFILVFCTGVSLLGDAFEDRLIMFLLFYGMATIINIVWAREE